MSSKRSGEPLRLDLKSSRLLLVSLAGIHIAAAVCVLVVIPYLHVSMLVLLPLIAVSAIYNSRRYALLLNDASIRVVMVSASTEWSLLRRDGGEISVTLCGDSYLHPWLVILNFSAGYRRYSVPILRDTLAVEEHRRLRVRLKTTNWFANKSKSLIRP